MIATSNEFGSRLLSLLGIDVTHVFSATIKIEVNEPIVVETAQYAYPREIIDDDLAIEVKRYELVEKQ